MVDSRATLEKEFHQFNVARANSVLKGCPTVLFRLKDQLLVGLQNCPFALARGSYSRCRWRYHDIESQCCTF